MKNPKISFLALANRNAKAGVNPTPALIETTANPKRCGFPVSRKKSGTIRAVRQHKLASKKGLVDFLDAADELHIFVGVLFE